MDDITIESEFDFDSYTWPPTERITPRRFITDCEHIGKGSCRDAFLGKDTVTQQPVVLKRFLGHYDATKIDRYWNEDISASRMAQQLARVYNKEMTTSKPIEFILPIVDTCTSGIEEPFAPGEKILVEPYLGNTYKKFNSNTGWTDPSCGLSMSTLSHFTYHITAGSLLLCDLQGVKKSDRYILTDPVICSQTQQYGLTDLGEDGIRSFFALHTCTCLCERSWRKHPLPSPYPDVRPATHFLL